MEGDVRDVRRRHLHLLHLSTEVRKILLPAPVVAGNFFVRTICVFSLFNLVPRTCRRCCVQAKFRVVGLQRAGI